MAVAWQPASRALLLGNFAIGCGVMVVAGSLNDLAHALAVSPAAAGQLITVGAVAMGLGAPLLAALLGRWDRRRLLALALLWYAAGHALAALMPGMASLMPVRAASVLGAAVFTPQAAAVIGAMAPPEHRGRAIAAVFLGWSVSSVAGMPMNGFISETFGWRWAFAWVAAVSLVAAVAVWRALPDGLRTPSPSLAGWGRVLASPLLMGMVAVTALSAAGQFTVFAYLAPFYSQVIGVDAAGLTFLFFWFGAFGLVGNLVVSRWLDRAGPARCTHVAVLLMATTMLAWPLATAGGPLPGVAAIALVLVPWALGCFACNSAQQARLSSAAPAYAPALLALNTSAIYAGQAAGAGGGGALLAAGGFAPLPWAGLAWLLLALGLSLWAARRMTAGVSPSLGHA